MYVCLSAEMLINDCMQKSIKKIEEDFAKSSLSIILLILGQRMDLFTILSSFLTILSSFLYKIFRNVAERNSERMKELRAFDSTKLGVKGLVDAGFVNIPKIFVRPAEELEEETLHHPKSHNVGIPVIDLDGLVADDCREKIVDEIRIASETWGFFQVVNHGIPLGVLDNMLAGIQKFHEGDIDVKKELYVRDPRVSVYLNSNYDLFKSKTVNWRDTLYVSMLKPDDFDPNQLPASCRYFYLFIFYCNSHVKSVDTI